jgi:hypothetical protein
MAGAEATDAPGWLNAVSTRIRDGYARHQERSFSRARSALTARTVVPVMDRSPVRLGRQPCSGRCPRRSRQQARPCSQRIPLFCLPSMLNASWRPGRPGTATPNSAQRRSSLCGGDTACDLAIARLSKAAPGGVLQAAAARSRRRAYSQTSVAACSASGGSPSRSAALTRSARLTRGRRSRAAATSSSMRARSCSGKRRLCSMRATDMPARRTRSSTIAARAPSLCGGTPACNAADPTGNRWRGRGRVAVAAR